MKKIKEGNNKEDFMEDQREGEEKVFLNNKAILGKNKEIEDEIMEYKNKNKMRRTFYQKKPLDK